MREYWVAKKPSAPSRMASLTSVMSGIALVLVEDPLREERGEGEAAGAREEDEDDGEGDAARDEED